MYFDRSLSSEAASKGRKRKKDDEEEEEHYEQKPRKLFGKEENMKSLLPIKTSKGVIQQVTQIKQEGILCSLYRENKCKRKVGTCMNTKCVSKQVKVRICNKNSDDNVSFIQSNTECLLYTTVVEESEIMEEKVETEPPEKPEELPTLTNVELYVNRQEKLRARKSRIAALASSLIANPEENVSTLLLLLCHIYPILLLRIKVNE